MLRLDCCSCLIGWWVSDSVNMPSKKTKCPDICVQIFAKKCDVNLQFVETQWPHWMNTIFNRRGKIQRTQQTFLRKMGNPEIDTRHKYATRSLAQMRPSQRLPDIACSWWRIVYMWCTQVGKFEWTNFSKLSTWPCGPMDKASAHGAGDCRFESYQGHCCNCHSLISPTLLSKSARTFCFRRVKVNFVWLAGLELWFCHV